MSMRVANRILHLALKRQILSSKIWTPENVRDSNAHVFGDGKARPVEALPLRAQSPNDLKGLGPHCEPSCFSMSAHKHHQQSLKRFGGHSRCDSGRVGLPR
jgi:hypothetical protein